MVDLGPLSTKTTAVDMGCKSVADWGLRQTGGARVGMDTTYRSCGSAAAASEMEILLMG